MLFSPETLRSGGDDASTTSVTPCRSRPVVVCAAEGDSDAIDSAVRTANSLTTAATFRTSDPDALIDVIFASRNTTEPCLILLSEDAVGGDSLAIFELLRSWEWAAPMVLACDARHSDWRERATSLDVVLVDRSAAIRSLPITVSTLMREGTSAVRCAACGSCINPTPFSEDAVGYFCTSCRSLGASSDLDDPWIDFGGGD